MKTLIVFIGVALLAGCSVRTPSASVSIGTGFGYHDGYYRGHYYDDDDYDHGYYRGDYYRGGHGGGYFCPPGQAKKGNC